MRTIVLNQTNLIQDGKNNKLVYNFPNSVHFKNNSIAVSSISMYYSWFNISAELQNNQFSVAYLDPTNTLVTIPIVIPDGVYEIATLNALLQFTLINEGFYLIDTNTNKNVYYAEFILNPSRYAVQVNTYLFPSSLPGGYAEPTNFVGFAVSPATTYNPVITFPANFNRIMGFPAGFATDLNINNSFVAPTSTFVAKNGAGTISYISTFAPQLQPNSSLYFSISNINNQYALPSSIIYALVPTVRVGEVIVERPPNFAWNALIDGTYNELRMTFLGSDLSPITINDPNMTILLVIKDNSEITGK
jgi:hypothetical protein